MLHLEAILAGVYFISPWERLQKIGHMDTLEDGLHPNDIGYNMMEDLIKNEAQSIKFFNE